MRDAPDCPVLDLALALAEEGCPQIDRVLARHGVRFLPGCQGSGGVPVGQGLGCLEAGLSEPCLRTLAKLIRHAFLAYERDAVFAGLRFPILVLDPEGRLADYNRAAAEVLGVGPADLGRPHPLVPPEHMAAFRQRLERHTRGERLGPVLREWRGRRYLVEALPLLDPEGRLWRLFDIWVDVTPVVAEQAFHEAVLELIRGVLAEGVGASFFQRVLDLARRFVPGAEAGSVLVRRGEVFRYVAVWNYPSEILGQAIAVEESWDRDAQGARILRPPSENNPMLRRLGRTAEIREVLTVPVQVGGQIRLSLNLDAFRTGAFRREDLARAEQLAGLLGLVLAWWEKSEEAEYNAYHDPLTGLPNERFLREVGGDLLGRLTGGEPVSVVAVDVVQLGEVNDVLSLAAGDRMLIEVARRLQATLFRGDLVVRTAGGEFAALLLRCDRAGAELAARRLLSAMQRPVTIAGQALSPTVRLGVAVARSGDEIGELWTQARLALARAKEEGRPYAFYDPEREAQRRSEARLEVALRRALSEGELRLFLQPIWDLVGERYTSAEVLLRWEEPPGRFIPLAEKRGLGPEVDRYVLERAGRLARRLGQRVWVNLLPGTLAQPGFPEEVAALADPKEVGLEVTEYALLTPPARDNLEALARAGFAVALDDFGTGYASLALLTELPLSRVKLDRSLIARFGDPRVRALLRGVAAIARDLGLLLVAEGIEDRAMLPALRELGFRYAQGYALARPGAPEAFFPRKDGDRA